MGHMKFSIHYQLPASGWLAVLRCTPMNLTGCNQPHEIQDQVHFETGAQGGAYPSFDVQVNGNGEARYVRVAPGSGREQEASTHTT